MRYSFVPAIASAVITIDKPTCEESCKDDWEQCRGRVDNGMYRGMLNVIEVWNEYNRCD